MASFVLQILLPLFYVYCFYILSCCWMVFPLSLITFLTYPSSGLLIPLRHPMMVCRYALHVFHHYFSLRFLPTHYWQYNSLSACTSEHEKNQIPTFVDWICKNVRNFIRFIVTFLFNISIKYITVISSNYQ